MKALFHAGLVFAICVFVTGCAGSGASSVTTATARLSGTRTVSPYEVKDAVVIGRSTKADLIANLGKTTAISFDTGFEVWVYQYAGAGVADETASMASPGERIEHADSETVTPVKTEYVVLFSPSGVVTKTRIRPAPRPRSAEGR